MSNLPENVTLSFADYSVLVELALSSASRDVAKVRAFVDQIDRSNGITRDAVLVRWTEADNPPPTTRFPTEWPPKQERKVETIGRPVSKKDIQDMLSANARKPSIVLVTRDLKGAAGWTELVVMFPLRFPAPTAARAPGTCGTLSRSARSAWSWSSTSWTGSRSR